MIKFKSYWKSLFTSLSIKEKIGLLIYAISVILFTIVSVNSKTNTLEIAGGWKGESWAPWGHNMFNPTNSKGYGIAGQILILIGTLSAILAASNRFLRFKQEIPFAIIANVGIGLGLLLQGIGTDGIVNLIIYGSISLSSWPIWYKNKTSNKVFIKSKFKLKYVMMSLSIASVVFAPILFMFAMLGNGGFGYKVNDFTDHKLYIDTLAATLAITAVIMMTIFKWSYSFILWIIVNFLCMYIYSANGFWNPTLFILMCFYSTIDAYIFYKWWKKA